MPVFAISFKGDVKRRDVCVYSEVAKDGFPLSIGE
jgi:hypothetical protein